jgi:murein DD-endopeptidase MepM/ murein hydrolase activator NlpD
VRTAVVGIAIALALAAALPAAADPYEELQENQQRQAQLQAKIGRLEADADRLSTRVHNADASVASAQAKVDFLDSKLGRLNRRLDEVRADLEAAQKRMALLTAELQDILRRLDSRMDAYSDRAIATYMAGPEAYLDGLLSSQSFSDLIDNYEYVASALTTDSTLVEEIESLRAATERRRNLVEEKEEEIARAKGALEEDKAEIASVRAARAEILQRRREYLQEKRGLLSDVQSTKAQTKRVLAQLQEDSARIRSLLSGGSTGAAVSGGGQLVWPASGPVTSGYGYRTHPIFGDQRLHTGIDIAAPYGAPVVAADSGVVSYAGVMSGYGNVVVVDHGGGLATVYAHLSSFAVGSGQSVSRGSTIAAVGCTGYCTGTHLHFEVRVNGGTVDPMPYLS